MLSFSRIEILEDRRQNSAQQIQAILKIKRKAADNTYVGIKKHCAKAAFKTINMLDFAASSLV